MVIEITNGFIIIDRADLLLARKYKWHVNDQGYAVWRGVEDGEKKTHRLHRLIVHTPKGQITDHINHNRLDNRRSNLRIVTQSENMRNLTDQGKGYWYHRKNKNWCVEIHGKHIGSFRTEAEAITIASQVRSGGTYIKPERTECKFGHSLVDAYRYERVTLCKPCMKRRQQEYYRRRIAK